MTLSKELTMAIPRLSEKQLQTACDRFNKEHPAGATVHVWTGVMHDGPPKVGTVRAPGAYVMGGHSAVVHVEGVRGCVAISHVEAATAAGT
jgi:hypothetical protein